MRNLDAFKQAPVPEKVVDLSDNELTKRKEAMLGEYLDVYLYIPNADATYCKSLLRCGNVPSLVKERCKARLDVLADKGNARR